MSEFQKMNDEEKNVLLEEEYQLSEAKKDFKYAGFWMRFWAYSFDLIIIASIGRIIIHPIFQMLDISTSSSFMFSPSSIATAIIWYGYFIVMTKVWSQTLGKMIFGLKVIPLKQKNLSWVSVLFREGVGRFIITFNFFTTLLYTVVAFTGKKQGIHDFIGETTVIHER